MSDRDLLVELRATVRERFDSLEARFTGVTKIIDDHETRIRGLDRRMWGMLVAAAGSGGFAGFGAEKLLGG